MQSPHTSPDWIWQHADWPRFTYREPDLIGVLGRARLAQGLLLGKARALGFANLGNAMLDIWSGEAQATAQIEGEHLELASVRSSVANKLGIDLGPAMAVPRAVSGLIDLMEDATRHWQQPLTDERLFSWQAALFPTGRSGLSKISVGAFRSSAAPMQIVSGPIGREKVHYVAPPSSAVADEMQAFLRWFESTQNGGIDGILRAGIAHLWFECIHPFEDGNGRVGRAITDMALVQDMRQDVRIYSLSAQILQDRDAYYAELNRASCGGLDVTQWLQWFVAMFEQACVHAERIIDQTLEKHRFWLLHNADNLNDRQRKVINKLLDAGPGGFEGGLSASKYASLTGVSRATATRELADLAKPRMSADGNGVSPAIFSVTGAARSTRYYPNIPGWVPGTQNDNHKNEHGDG